MITFNFPDDLAHLPSHYEGQAPKKGETVIINNKDAGRTHQFRVTKVSHYFCPDPVATGHLIPVEIDVFLEEVKVAATAAAVGC